MRHLYKVFNEQDKSTFEKQFAARSTFDSAVHFDLDIKPINQPEAFDLFYIPTNKMLQQMSTVQKLTRLLNHTHDKLPSVARHQFLLECLVEELYNTNELEGVRSTKKEIARSVREAQSNKKSNSRFNSMSHLYLRLVNGEISLPKVPADVRTIYDDITKGEIDSKELPDGETFRKDTTFIYKKSGSGKVIHRGVHPESNIKKALEKLIHFMDENEEVPLIIKAIVGHFFFGYVHPFYDGNGRTSRFISSMYMSTELGKVSAMSLSRGCNKYSKKYLEAFENTNSFKSKGEMNHFIETLMEIIIDALQEMNTELKEKYELLTKAKNKIRQDSQLPNDKHREIMFIIAQNYFFDYSDGITVKELAHETEQSKVTVRKILNELMALDLLKQTGKRPAFYTIDCSYIES